MLKILLFFLSMDTQYTYEVIPFETMAECRQAENDTYSGYNSLCVVVTEKTINDLEAIIHAQAKDD